MDLFVRGNHRMRIYVSQNLDARELLDCYLLVNSGWKKVDNGAFVALWVQSISFKMEVPEFKFQLRSELLWRLGNLLIFNLQSPVWITN